MSRGKYSLGKRQREQERMRKKREKADRRREKREQGTAEVEVVARDHVIADQPSVEDVMRSLEEGPARTKGGGSGGPPCRLFVGNLSLDTSESTLRATLQAFGPITDSVIIKDRSTGESRGFGFVTMQSRKDAAKALDELHESELDGRTIVVRIANDRDR